MSRSYLIKRLNEILNRKTNKYEHNLLTAQYSVMIQKYLSKLNESK